VVLSRRRLGACGQGPRHRSARAQLQDRRRIFQAAAKGRNLQQAVFIDSTGRAYSLPAHQLPAARGQGEPLSGSGSIRPMARRFAAVLIGEPEDLWLLASDAGYGFKLGELYARNKKGKSVLEGARKCARAAGPADFERAGAGDFRQQRRRSARAAGAAIEEMSAGKGQNLYGIPGKKSADRDEFLVAIAVVAPGRAAHDLQRQQRADAAALRGSQAVRGQEGSAPAALFAGLQAGRPARGLAALSASARPRSSHPRAH
jgi:topoisomerase IV subunit A